MSACPRILCENRTPGRHGSADGPTREVHIQCCMPEGHMSEHCYLENDAVTVNDPEAER